MRRCALHVMLFCFLCPLNTVSAQLAEEEQAIIQEIDERADEAIDFLEESVNINSGTMNFEGIRAVYELYHEKFEALGVETNGRGCLNIRDSSYLGKTGC